MYIAPNTVIRILNDVPLDNTYDHTVYFQNESQQITYFQEFTKYTLSAQSYQRLQKGSMRVEIRAENLYDCNYIMYQNTAFGNKWFYAFITSVEYVNNETSEITFQIDVMQTWYFDYTVDQSFVEREHSSTDVAGDNLVPENLELGEYVVDNEVEADEIDRSMAVVLATNYYYDHDLSSWTDVFGSMVGKVYRGLVLIKSRLFNDDGTFRISNHEGFVPSYVPDSLYEISEYIRQINEKGKGDAILGVFMVPWFLFESEGFIHPTGAGWRDAGHLDIEAPKCNTSQYHFRGYYPRNNKLYTYPYNFLYVTNNSGGSAYYPYEYWINNDNQCHFYISGDPNINPTLVCIPQDYKIDGLLPEESIQLKGFPQCAFNTDAFKAWLAQNSAALVSQTTLGVGSAVLGAFAGVVSQNPVLTAGAIASGISAVSNAVSSVHGHSVVPDNNRGQSQSAPMLSLEQMHFVFYRKHITAQFARIIDEFFDRFGYKTNRNKVPNHCNTNFTRPHWGYTKTISCSVTGSVPADDMAEICSIYDNGITFWRSTSTVCDYTQDNTI